MRAQQLGGEFKRDARARGGFIKQKRDALAAEQRFGLAGMHPPGQLKKKSNFIRREVLEFEERAFARHRLRNAFHHQDLFFLVNLSKLYFNDFAVRGLYGAAHEGSFNGQLAVSAINEHAELHAARAAVVK